MDTETKVEAEEAEPEIDPHEVGVFVRFCVADHSKQDGVYQGEVKNLDVYVRDNESFKEEIRKLVAECNKKKKKNGFRPDDLTIYCIAFNNGHTVWGVKQTSNTKHVYRDPQKIVEYVGRDLNRIREGKGKSLIAPQIIDIPDFGPIREYLIAHDIDLLRD